MKKKLKGKHAVSALSVVAALAFAACGGDDDGGETGDAPALPRGSEPVTLDPAEFTTRIDNPYWPMTPGSVWVYREREDESELRVEVTVTSETKEIANGVEARVVHDVVTEDGQLIEDTRDWYAQDSGGNVWYLGEDTKEYEEGKVSSTAGSWEAGVDGAQPGVIMPAEPRVGLEYRQEYYAGEAEDRGRVLALDATASVPFGEYTALKTEDVAPLPPPEVEHKLYARGVGPVLTVVVSGGTGREELVSFRPGTG
jgi:hypothetical protein